MSEVERYRSDPDARSPPILKSFGSAPILKSFGSPPPPPPPPKAMLRCPGQASLQVLCGRTATCFLTPSPCYSEILPFTSAQGIAILALALVTHLARPSSIRPLGAPHTAQHVFYYAWVAAISTGLGALPLMLLRRGKLGVGGMWLARAVCNALAGEGGGC